MVASLSCLGWQLPSISLSQPDPGWGRSLDSLANLGNHKLDKVSQVKSQ